MEGRSKEAEVIKAVPRVIVSYDVVRGEKRRNTLVYMFVHGRTATARTSDGTKKYSYPGLIHRDEVVHLGQSVLMMKEGDAEDFIAFLRRLHVSYFTERVWLRL